MKTQTFIKQLMTDYNIFFNHVIEELTINPKVFKTQETVNSKKVINLQQILTPKIK